MRVRVVALAAVILLAAGCATPGAPPTTPAPPSAAGTPTTSPTPAAPSSVATHAVPTLGAPPAPTTPPSPHDADEPGAPVEKRPFALPEGIPADHLSFDPATYDVRERVLHGTRVVVASHRDLAPLEPAPGAFAEFVWSGFDDAWHAFGGHLYDEARVVLRGPEEPCAFRSATPVGFVVCAQDHASGPDASRPPHPMSAQRIPELVLHEMLHMWIGGAFASVARDVDTFPEEAWFTEGATTYEAARLLGPEGHDRAMAAEWRAYQELARDLEGMGFAELAAASSHPGEPPNAATRMLYARGALVSHLLDEQLRAHGATFDDVLAALYREHALRGEPWDVDDLRTIAEGVAGADLAPFWDAYVSGGTPIDGPPRWL